MIASALSFIFGGCCSNAYALEALVREFPSSGILITFSQFILITIEGLIYFLLNDVQSLKHPKVPRKRWFVVVVMFFAINVLNNVALGFDISVPVHIILRSSGPLTTMAVGRILAGKRYSSLQIGSVFILTIGVIIATLGNAKDLHLHVESMTRFGIGFTILVITQILGAIMGLVLENTYRIYGSDWRESLFYTHALSLPFFLFLLRPIRSQWNDLFAIHTKGFLNLPSGVWYLCFNTLAQYFCVRGVNALGAETSALTVSVVLNVRKFVSLCLSLILFDNEMGSAVKFGALLVFGSSAVYASARSKPKTNGLKKND